MSATIMLETSSRTDLSLQKDSIALVLVNPSSSPSARLSDHPMRKERPKAAKASTRARESLQSRRSPHPHTVVSRIKDPFLINTQEVRRRRLAKCSPQRSRRPCRSSHNQVRDLEYAECSPQRSRDLDDRHTKCDRVMFEEPPVCPCWRRLRASSVPSASVAGLSVLPRFVSRTIRVCW